jgi:hypothetical protein
MAVQTKVSQDGSKELGRVRSSLVARRFLKSGAETFVFFEGAGFRRKGKLKRGLMLDAVDALFLKLFQILPDEGETLLRVA